MHGRKNIKHYCLVVIFVKIDALAAVVTSGNVWNSVHKFRIDLNQPNITSHKHITLSAARQFDWKLWTSPFYI